MVYCLATLEVPPMLCCVAMSIRKIGIKKIYTHSSFFHLKIFQALEISVDYVSGQSVSITASEILAELLRRWKLDNLLVKPILLCDGNVVCDEDEVGIYSHHSRRLCQ